jgi:PHP family Zn ribbon phosphoesterase
LGSEFEILLDVDYEEIRKASDSRIADRIMNVREGSVSVKPGYDGVFGEVTIECEQEEKKQLELFS